MSSTTPEEDTTTPVSSVTEPVVETPTPTSPIAEEKKVEKEEEEDAFTKQIRAMMAANPNLASQMMRVDDEKAPVASSGAARDAPKTWCIYCPTVIFQAGCASRDTDTKTVLAIYTYDTIPSYNVFISFMYMLRYA